MALEWEQKRSLQGHVFCPLITRHTGLKLLVLVPAMRSMDYVPDAEAA